MTSNVISELLADLHRAAAEAADQVDAFAADPEVPDSAKMIAAAVREAGAEIARAVLLTR